ncbi:hypothetical protein DSO57_1020609 [Entomophthora muscae]|uniref:Uncharacterized protein n=1 Tax=Entomophthora muscae TaxID=34485 RepID=A0ACC2UP47_9FUNG|nr:hypothetical protein DSO57_1020609 [Entomophthora muscae]
MASGGFCLNRIFRRTRYRRPILIVIGIALFCAIVVPVYHSYRREGLKGGSHFEYPTYEGPSDQVALHFNLLNMDPVARKADFLVQVDLMGRLQDGDGALTKNLTLNMRFKQLKFMAHQTIEPFTMTVPFTEGTVRDYPLEFFVAEFPITIRGDSYIPFHATFDGLSQLFKIRFNAFLASESLQEMTLQQIMPRPDVIILVTLQRPPTTLMICAFMAALMWVLAIAMANLAWDGVIYRREIPPPLLSIGIAMLFALPTLRNSQPGVPAMGCLIDMLGFFWSIVLISISASALIFNYVLGWKPPCFRDNE